MKLVKESIFKAPTRDKFAGHFKEVYDANKELNDLGIKSTIRHEEFSKEILELFIDDLEYEFQVAYLPYEYRKHNDSTNEDWGWGIYELEEGELIIGGTRDWTKVKEKIIELIEEKNGKI